MLTSHLHLVPRSRMVGQYLHSDIRPPGVVLNLSPVIILPLPLTGKWWDSILLREWGELRSDYLACVRLLFV
jgi:hypothetical protein